MRTLNPIWTGLFLLLVAGTAQAGGGWHSSGGELFRDAKNPWFVSNTRDVNYCVRVDSASINASADTIRRLIRDAIGYWKSEFRRSIKLSAGHVDIATQEFHEVDCALGVADVSFLFGYGTLNEEQIKFLDNPAKYIGVTVRTDYDTTNLRGKGFVYISSDFGPHAYTTADLRKYALIPEAWKKEPLLFYALLHEIGHMFGMPHTGSGLMSEVFLEQLLNQNIYEAFIKSPVESFLFPNPQLDSCDLLTGPEKTWFGAPLDTKCIRLEMRAPYEPIVVSAKGPGEGAEWKRIGAFTRNETNLFDIRHRPAVTLALPEEQKVFTPQQANYRSFMVGGMFYEAGSNASYLADANPVPRTAYLSTTSMSVHATGSIAGQAKTVFNYNSWIATKLFLSNAR